METDLARMLGKLSVTKKIAKKPRLVKRKGKLVKVTPLREEAFKEIFNKHFPKKYHYAYSTAVKYLINKPKNYQISELKRVVREYDEYMTLLNLSKMKI